MGEWTKICTVRICDFCETDKDVYCTCLECGKDICWICKPKYAKEYTHACWVGGGGDGLYCFKCIGQLMENKDQLFQAYLAVEMLMREYSNWYEDFKKRADAADKILAALIAKRKAENEAKAEKQTNAH